MRDSCPRCDGFLFPDNIFTIQTPEGLDIVKCANCGLVIDPLILYNQEREYPDQDRRGVKLNSRIRSVMSLRRSSE